MCGIAGIWDRDGASPAAPGELESMLGDLEHRGPDDSGTWFAPAGGPALGQRRLAVIDLSAAGHQPMTTEDGQFSVTFNGEIYNFPELRRELAESGAVFRSRCDTEVILRGYERWGAEVVDRLVGMFAFAIWDERKRELFLARDRAGEKPLYYAEAGRRFAFASEIPALRRLPEIDSGVDREALALYLSVQYVPAPFSIYRGIRQLPPAHTMFVTEREVSIRRYWDPVELATGPRLQIDENEAVERLDSLLRTAVLGQQIADVPLGVFLSGGIDSSAVVGMMAETCADRVKTFTIGFEDAAYDEAPHAAAVAEHLGTDHTVEYLTERELFDLVPRIPQIYGEPFADSSALPTHLVSMVARKQVTVSLSGDGGDEAFGGYTRYRRLEKLQRLLRYANPGRGALGPLLRMRGGRTGRWANHLGLPLSEVYRNLIGVYTIDEVASMVGLRGSLHEYDRAWAAGDSGPRRHAMLADLLTYLPGAILTKVDRAAMAVSLETRAPLLDHRILEFSLALPENLVVDKTLLRRVAFRRVPAALLERPKKGFGLPLQHWFRKGLRDPLCAALAPARLRELGIENTDLVTQMLERHLAGTQNNQARLWSLFVLSMWEEHQRPAASASRLETNG